MTRLVLRISLIAVPICLCLYYSISQNANKDNYELLLSLSKRADSFYNAATFLGNSENYTEQKEMQLNKSALNYYREVFQKSPATAKYDSLRFFSAFHVGELEHYFENFTGALDGYNQSISIKTKSKLPDSLLFKPYIYCGIIYYNQNKYDSASLYFRNAEKIQGNYNYTLSESERLYNTFGVLCYEKGDYKQAKNYFLKAIEILPRSNTYYRQLLLNYKINLAQIYFKLEDYDKANEIYQTLLDSNPPDKNLIYHNVGLINLYLGAAGKALEHFRKVNYTSNKIVVLYQNMGEAFYNLEQFDSAKIYFDKAITTSARLGSNTDHIGYGKALKSSGDLALHFNEPHTALRNYQKAIQQFYPSFTDTAIKSNPFRFSGVFSYINLFNALLAKADAFQKLYDKSTDLTWAEEELKTYQSAFQLVDYVERTYNSDEARLFLNKIKYVVHSKPIDIAFLLYSKTGKKKFLEDLYVFDQKNKASVLAIQTQLKEDISSGDSSLFQKEQRIRSDITRLSLQATQVNDSNQLETINNNIRDKEIELGKIQDELSADVAINKIPAIDFLQKNILDHKTALISYHLSGEGLTTLYITKEKLDCYQQKFFENFHEYINRYIDSLKIASSKSQPEIAFNIFHFLFNQLDLKNVERLIIIPDDELNYLPFESLQEAPGKYLIENFDIQYQHSTALLKRERVNLRNHETLSFAPFTHTGYTDSSIKLSVLPKSLEEINNLKGKKFIDSAATKSNFLNNISNYSVIHLATHAIVNSMEEKQSFISFYPSSKNDIDFLLYTEEIYNLPLNRTNLVILSACETGYGNLIKGEGIMSLSRAFAYAGCSNIITSLWNASDLSTAYLTNKVHQYLDKNYAIDAALRQAKLDYLNEKSIHPRLKHPFYWSHLVFIGNYTPEKKPVRWWLFVIAGTSIAGLLIFIKKKASQNAKLGSS